MSKSAPIAERRYIVPLVCHAYVFYFALREYRPSTSIGIGGAVAAPAGEA